jgi:transcriptional regulator with XRE-family HTH domain
MNKDEALKALRKFKKESGWSYDKIAREMGVHSQTVAGWLQGKYKPSLLALPLVETFLKKHVSDPGPRRED